MKKLLFTALIAAVAASCKKEQALQKRHPVQELPVLTPCVELDRTKFIGNWKYVSIQNRNDQFPQMLEMGVLQDIVITKDSIKFKNFPFFGEKWTYLDCSIIKGVNGEEDVLVSFFGGNIMTFEGKRTGTIWTLRR